MLDMATFDDGMTDVFLAMAAQERLIEPGPNECDGVFASMARKSSPDWMKQQVLEQIVLTPKVFTRRDFSLGFLAGQLFDEGNLQHISPASTTLFRLGGFSRSIIGGMLRGSGYDIPEDEFQPRLDRCFAALKEEEDYEAKHHRKLPSAIEMPIYRFFRRGRDPRPEDLNEEELQAQEARHRVYQEASPLLNCMNEYLDLAAIAQSQNTLLTTPIHPTNDTILAAPPEPVEGEAPEIALVRIVAHGLGKLSFRPTLRESLALARDPATVALREELPMWLDELATGNIGRAELVQREIGRATKGLKVASVGSGISNLTTWVGVPIGVVELLLGLPPSLGLTVSAIGTGGAATAAKLSRKYHWATFGNT